MFGESLRRLGNVLRRGSSAATSASAAETAPSKRQAAGSGRQRAIEERHRSIEEQRQAIGRAEAERASIARQGPPDRLDDADYRLAQMRRYLDELEGDLRELERAPPLRESSGAPYDDPLEWPELEPREAAGNGIALVVGHTLADAGAIGRFEPDLGEYHWNKDLARRIEEICKSNGIRVGTFFRDGHGVTGAYRQVSRFGPEVSVELHFNAANAKARGTETIFELAISEGWARVLQAEMLGAFAGPSRDALANKGDRKIKKASVENRGVQSLTQLRSIPSALTEPFFGDVIDECRLATACKNAYARAIVAAYLKHTNRPPLPAIAEPAIPAPVAAAATAAAAGGPVTPVVADVPPPPAASIPAGPTPAAVGAASATMPAPAAPAAAAPAAAQTVSLPLGMTAEFEKLRAAYERTTIEFPHLRAITYAQWAHESDFGRSVLATKHRNFAGMKWVGDMRKFAREVVYNPAHDPDGRTYCGFDDFEKFIAGYWHRLDLPSLPYATKDGGWRKHAATADEFIDFIGPIWAPRGGSNSSFNEGYESKVRKRLAQLAAAGRLPSNAPADPGRPPVA